MLPSLIFAQNNLEKNTTDIAQSNLEENITDIAQSNLEGYVTDISQKLDKLIPEMDRLHINISICGYNINKEILALDREIHTLEKYLNKKKYDAVALQNSAKNYFILRSKLSSMADKLITTLNDRNKESYNIEVIRNIDNINLKLFPIPTKEEEISEIQNRSEYLYETDSDICNLAENILLAVKYSGKQINYTRQLFLAIVVDKSLNQQEFIEAKTAYKKARTKYNPDKLIEVF